MPDNVYWSGDAAYVDESTQINSHNLRVRDLDYEDTDAHPIRPGPIVNGSQTDFRNRRPPTGDPRETLNGEAFAVGDSTNTARSYVNSHSCNIIFLNLVV